MLRFFVLCICVIISSYTHAQTDAQTTNTAASETPPPRPLAEQLFTSANTFAQDVARQIRDDIIPIKVGQMALSALVSPSLLTNNKGVIVFIADGQTNASRLTLYRKLAEGFRHDGFVSLVVVLPYPEEEITDIDTAATAWQPALSAIKTQLLQYQAPTQLVVAHGQIGTTLLHLYQQQALTSPTALVLDNVFFDSANDNQKIPELISQQTLPILDFHGRTNHPLSQKTAVERAYAGKQLGVRSYRQKELLGMGIDRKQAGFIQKEIKGFIKNLGWI